MTGRSGVEGLIYDRAGGVIGGWSSAGERASLAQLRNGNVVVATENAGTVFFEIVNGTTGARVVRPTDIGDAGSSAPAVAALPGGRFLLATQDRIGSQHDIDLRIYGPGGAPLRSLTVDATAANDIDPRVATLQNGSFVVTWTRVVQTDTQLWYAIYGPTGDLVRAPARLDAVGTINQNASVAAIPGGFAVAYEDNEWGTNGRDITLAQFDLAGNLLRRSNATGDRFSDETRPALASVAPGLIALAYNEDDSFGSASPVLKLLDAQGRTLRAQDLGEASIVGPDPGVAALPGGRLVAFVDDKFFGGQTFGSFIQIAVAVVGDAAANTFVANALPSAFDGRQGIDLVSYAQSPAAVRVNLNLGKGSGGHAEGDTYVSIENVRGSSFADLIVGDDRPNRLIGGPGADTLHGLGGADVLDGGAGPDILRGGPGADLATYAASPAGVRVDLALGTGTGGHAAGDRLVSIENLIGSALADTLLGSAAANRLNGGGGNDVLHGRAGNDQLIGGPGADALIGGAGNDVLVGGPGPDAFHFRRGFDRDRIADFQNDVDTLVLDRALVGAGRGTQEVLSLFATDVDTLALVGGTGPQQVLNLFASQKGVGTVELDFGGGDVLTVQGPGLRVAHLVDDLIFA